MGEDFLPWWLQPWKWPEYLMKWLRGLHEVREAKYKADQAKEELRVLKNKSELTDFETKVQEMMRTIRQMMNKEKAKYPGRNIATQLEAGPEDDKEVFDEAMRRMRKELRD